MKRRCAHHLVVVGMVFILTQIDLCLAQSTSDNWLIVASAEKGVVNLHTTRVDLVRSFGNANVVDKDVDVGEGETEPGTVVFPNDPERRIEILWKDPEKKNEPKSATISGSTSRWHATHSISLGTSLEQLQSINGFRFLSERTNLEQFCRGVEATYNRTRIRTWSRFCDS